MALVLAAFEHIKDRYGYDKSDLELLHCVDDEFLAALGSSFQTEVGLSLGMS